MSLRGLTNSHLTSWKKRTGSDAQGQPTYGSEQITKAVPIVANQPASRHIVQADKEGFAVSFVLLVATRWDVNPGDRVQVSHSDALGKGLIVRVRNTVEVPGLRGRELMCQWEAGS